MSPIFYEDSLGEKLARKATEAMDAAHEENLDEIEDLGELERAEAAVRGVDPQADYEALSEDRVVVFGPTKLSGILDVAGFNARLIAMPLDSEGIAYAWDPYPPEEMPGTATPVYHAVDRPFSLLVNAEDEDRARALLTANAGSSGLAGFVAEPQRTPEAAATRRRFSATTFMLLYGLGLIVAILGALWAGLQALGVIK
ncbi:MAG: hypothetical protein HGB10_00980 [Coriobacteriia bacterium]|nr:hypothetical protein [Coriobacteriia bacterium]